MMAFIGFLTCMVVGLGISYIGCCRIAKGLDVGDFPALGLSMVAAGVSIMWAACKYAPFILVIQGDM